MSQYRRMMWLRAYLERHGYTLVSDQRESSLMRLQERLVRSRDYEWETRREMQELHEAYGEKIAELEAEVRLRERVIDKLADKLAGEGIYEGRLTDG